MPSPSRPRWTALAPALALAVCLSPTASVDAASPLQTNDVVAFIGGASTVAADQSGLLETVLTLAHPGYRLQFRSVAWEGDSVFAQPRELNFPPTPQVLRRVQATVALTHFGALESLDPTTTPEAFAKAYGQVIDEIRAVTPRLLLVIPPPFEPQSPPLPDYSAANASLERLAIAIRALAAERRLRVVDLHQAFLRHPPSSRWTHDGREWNPTGHRAVVGAFAREFGFPSLADQVESQSLWKQPETRELLAAVSYKNRLWFDFWRPMNWAFLAGDRTEQQASRDHRDRNIRWFPTELEQFNPLIADAEVRIQSLASQIRFTP